MNGQAMPAVLERLRKQALVVGVAGTAVLALGGFLDPTQFFRSYLFGWLFWTGMSLGCLSLLMIYHLTGGLWGVAIRRDAEAGAKVLFFALPSFLPLALGLPRLYTWARPDEVAKDPILLAKAPYLNPGFFLGRALFYFALWALLVHFLTSWSSEQDKGENPRLEGRMRGLSGAGLVLMGLTTTFASVDWAMSLDPHWFSTIYGILFMVGNALAALALVIVMLALLADEKPLAEVARPTVLHDLGKLLLAFTMLWAYVNLSQFLITWSGNLPEEIPWYLRRLRGGWQYVGLFLIVFHFALPFVLLLSRGRKKNVRQLAAVAVWMLVARVVDLFWMLAPEHTARAAQPPGLWVHWLDVVAPVGLGGLWLAAFCSFLGARPLLPLGDPELKYAQEAP